MIGRAFLVLALLGTCVAAAQAADLQARLSRTQITMGETAGLEIEIGGSPILGNQKPELGLPPDLEVLGTSQSSQMTFVNGRASSTVVFRYELGPQRTGTFTIGPIRVRAGREVLEYPALTLRVSASQTRIAGGATATAAAALTVDVTPRDPYVGQPVFLRVRLIQRQEFGAEPDYSPPAAQGFWAERYGPRGTFEADEGGRRVLVTEQAARLYPLAAGALRVGPATATVYLYDRSRGVDPMQLLGGGRLRPVPIRSAEIAVRVRPLPPGAPEGFDGATGAYTVTFSTDRQRTTQDVPVTAWLEVRGDGNVPFIRTPDFAADGFEVFGSTVEDSFPPAGSPGTARRRFQWTVLPRRMGRLDLVPPRFSWFDPTSARYRTADLPAYSIVVGPTSGPTGAEAEAFPSEFARHPLDPAARPAEPWAFAIVGVTLGLAWRLARRPVSTAGLADQARRREFLQAIGLSEGLESWTAAEQAAAWLESQGQPVTALREQIAAVRYGGGGRDPDAVRQVLTRQLSHGIAPRTPRWVWQAGAASLALAALVIAFLFAPHAGESGPFGRARRAEDLARRGEIEGARREWLQLWREGSRSPGLAARLAWVEGRAGRVAPASVWVLRGDREEPRDPALRWVQAQVRDAGGLGGFAPARLPLRRLEWAIVALVMGAAAVLLWPRRVWAGAALALALVAALDRAVEDRWIARANRAVVARPVNLVGTGLGLEPGQVVDVVARSGPQVRVVAGRGVVGTLPADVLLPLEPRP